MGFTRHRTLKCHTCKRRHASGGAKKTGSLDQATRVGWVLMVRSTLGASIWLCPSCARKHASTKLPIGPTQKKRK
jgi:hypothetical protein